MRQIYLVWCGHCGGSFTGAHPPDHPDFAKVVRCVLCNRELDATKGKCSFYPTRGRPKEEIDLLKVS